VLPSIAVSGRFVVIEGIDGAGTTTQTARLVAELTMKGHDAHGTREPSTGPVGQLLRKILGGAHAPVDGTTMALLFAADRADHLAREIVPALQRGAIVVSDRYYHSSFAYQATETDGQFVERINHRARAADLSVLLRVPAETAALRRARAGRAVERYDDLPVQRRVAEHYDRVFARLADKGERVAIVDGGQEPDAVLRELLALVETVL